MRLCRYDSDRLGVVRDGQVFDATAALEAIPPRRPPYPIGDPVVAALPELRPAIEAAAGRATPRPLSSVRLEAPVWHVGKVVAAPVNYRKHMEESEADPAINFNRQVLGIRTAGLFLKATSSIIGPSDPVRLRFPDRRNDHEVELALVIGRTARDVRAADALPYVAGYCVGLDMTVRGTEDRSFRKSVDSYTVLGPWLVTADEVPNPSDLPFSITVNGEVRQHARTSDLLLGIGELIEFATRYYTLHPGDVIMTGTPEGVGPVLPGDMMHARIEGIGEMTVRIEAAA
ncbi:fumarylacetoacetate hydrolase family protein [Roseomonas sp. CCTCC AB2023176]|uniref:fumarylacetoacetate hydrolase family protein n=1 Tax=Roseomonas sp. CCTCC AB2023176 TaxID=3342640 RepID=UPI0035D746BA